MFNISSTQAAQTFTMVYRSSLPQQSRYKLSLKKPSIKTLEPVLLEHTKKGKG